MNRRSKLKKKLVWIMFFMGLFIADACVVNATGTEQLNSPFTLCESEMSQFGIDPDDVLLQGYLIAYGCSAISAQYNMQSLFSSLGMDAYLTESLRTPMIALFSGWNAADERWKRLQSKLETINRFERKRISKSPIRLLYYIVAADISKAQSTRHLTSEFRKLTRKVPTHSIDSFALVYSSVSRQFPNDASQTWVSTSLKMLQKIHLHRLNRILQDPASSLMLAVLTLINRSDIHSIKSISHYQFLELQNDVLELQLYVFDRILEKTDSTSKAMQVSSLLKPYLVNALVDDTNKEIIQPYLRQQLDAPVFTSKLGDSDQPLQNEKLRTLLARMYAPVSASTGQPISYLQGNLGKIAQWYSDDPNTVQQLLFQKSEPDLYSATFAFLPNIYLSLGKRGRKAFENLLANGSSNMINNGIFISGLFYKTAYFQWVEAKGSGAFESVRFPSGAHAPKYQYIITAPYSLDDPTSFIENFNDGYTVDHQALMQFTALSPAQLEGRLVKLQSVIAAHSQQNEGNHWVQMKLIGLTVADYFDTAFTLVGIVGAIIAATETGGFSLVAIAALFEHKVVFKAMIKKLKDEVKDGISEQVEDQTGIPISSIGGKRKHHNSRRSSKKTSKKNDSNKTVATNYKCDVGLKYYVSSAKKKRKKKVKKGNIEKVEKVEKDYIKKCGNQDGLSGLEFNTLLLGSANPKPNTYSMIVTYPKPKDDKEYQNWYMEKMGTSESIDFRAMWPIKAPHKRVSSKKWVLKITKSLNRELHYNEQIKLPKILTSDHCNNHLHHWEQYPVLTGVKGGFYVPFPAVLHTYGKKSEGLQKLLHDNDPKGPEESLVHNSSHNKKKIWEAILK